MATPRSLAALATEVRAFLGDDRPDAVGTTVAGVLDQATGTVLTSANLPWLTGTNPAAALSAALGIPAVAVHDGNAAATAEAVLGAGRGHHDLFVLALGTGIAGAHIVGGELRRGAHGAAGEIGHTGPGTGRLCSCGRHGCLESSIGGAQLAARWSESRSPAGSSDGTRISNPAGSPPPGATDSPAGSPAGSPSGGARAVVEAAERGDPAAVTLLDEATTALSHGLLNVIALVDPGLIVVGGGLSEARRWIVDPAVAKVSRNATFHHVPPIVPAALGVWAGAWGATLAARDTLG
ncbi:ROK family protein [Actinoplanes rectilineatus]|uniref:ROK family protein n=1 Tax=Actinoplanes rectilineatus TaxID=113571 RepID=UPI000697111D|nr:ROK family protein [Actinoplanes rectilineatus]